MAIREGAPQPIIAILVGVGRVRRELGEREEDGDERVRMYSWQFYHSPTVSHTLFLWIREGEKNNVHHRKSA